MKTIVTVHAIEQYQKRWNPEASFAEAESDIKGLLYRAKSIGKTPLGHTIVVSSVQPDIRLVLKEKNVCVTVLPKSNGDIKRDLIAEEFEEFQEEINKFIESQKENIEEIEARFVEVNREIVEIEEKRDALNLERNNLYNEKDRLSTKIKKLRL